jgi:arylsulfatase A-like enzyme
MARWIDIRGTGGGEAVWRRSAALTPILLAVVWWAACGGAGEPSSPRPNIVLVTLDTLRADSLGAYGYHRDTSPFLDSLAGDGLRCAQAYSVSSWTVPAMASLFTGLHPESHGVAHGLVTAGEITGQEVLAEEFQLLAEVLQRAGYRTFAVAASLHLDRKFGFSQGFDRFENVGFANAPKALAALEEMAGEVLEGEGPYFLWLHLFDPHDPYKPRRPWIRDYFSSPRELRQHLSTREPSADESPDPVVDYARAVYDSEINFTDRAVYRAFDILGVSADDLIVVTSDHGEEFLEHHDFGHAGSLYEEQVRIPLIVRLPDLAHAGKVIEQPVSLLDVLPSILDWLDLEPPAPVQGRSFLSGLEDGDSPEQAIYLSLSRPQTQLSGVRAGPWKYIHDHGDEGEHRLYDLGRDPEERRNLIPQEPGRARQLARDLSSHLQEASASRLEVAVEEVSAETLEQLRALGYVD